MFDLLKLLLFAILPATEDTTANEDYHEIISTNNDVIEVPTALPRTHATIVIWGPYVGLVRGNAAALAEMSLNIKDGVSVQTAQIAAGALFATSEAEVWYNPTTGEVTDTEAAGLYGIGPVVTPLNANGVMVFNKRRYWIANSFDT